MWVYAREQNHVSFVYTHKRLYKESLNNVGVEINNFVVDLSVIVFICELYQTLSRISYTQWFGRTIYIESFS